jgi:hypothetical protein
MTLNNLAMLLESESRCEEAVPLLERALRIFEKMLPSDHPKTAACLQNFRRISPAL